MAVTEDAAVFLCQVYALQSFTFLTWKKNKACKINPSARTTQTVLCESYSYHNWWSIWYELVPSGWWTTADILPHFPGLVWHCLLWVISILSCLIHFVLSWSIKILANYSNFSSKGQQDFTLESKLVLMKLWWYCNDTNLQFYIDLFSFCL